MLAGAAARFREAFPAVELRIKSATCVEGLRRLAVGEGGLHCGGIDVDEALPGFLRRERFLDLTAGIVAWRGHPLFESAAGPGDLARYPWIDFDWPVTASQDGLRPSLAAVLAEIRGAGPGRVVTVLRLGAAGLFALARGPWLAWLATKMLRRLPGGLVRPLPVEIDRFRYRTGFVARRSAEKPAAVPGVRTGRARHRPRAGRVMHDVSQICRLNAAGYRSPIQARSPVAVRPAGGTFQLVCQLVANQATVKPTSR